MSSASGPHRSVRLARLNFLVELLPREVLLHEIVGPHLVLGDVARLARTCRALECSVWAGVQKVAARVCQPSRRRSKIVLHDRMSPHYLPQQILDAMLVRMTALRWLYLCQDDAAVSIATFTAVAPRLEVLQIFGAQNQVPLVPLELCTNLTELSFDSLPVPNLPKLTRLVSNYTTDTANLSKLTNLVQLGIHGPGTFTDDAVARLTNLRRLELLDAMDDLQGTFVSALEHLQTLSLRDAEQFSGSAFVILPSLTELSLISCPLVMDADIVDLTRLQKLQIRANAQLTGRCLRRLVQLEWLILEPDGDQIDTFDGACIAPLVNLQILGLTLFRDSVPPTSFRTLTRLRALHYSTVMSDADTLVLESAIRALNLPALVDLRVV